MSGSVLHEESPTSELEQAVDRRQTDLKDLRTALQMVASELDQTLTLTPA